MSIHVKDKGSIRDIQDLFNDNKKVNKATCNSNSSIKEVYTSSRSNLQEFNVFRNTVKLDGIESTNKYTSNSIMELVNGKLAIDYREQIESNAVKGENSEYVVIRLAYKAKFDGLKEFVRKNMTRIEIDKNKHKIYFNPGLKILIPINSVGQYPVLDYDRSKEILDQKVIGSMALFPNEYARNLINRFGYGTIHSTASSLTGLSFATGGPYLEPRACGLNGYYNNINVIINDEYDFYISGSMSGYGFDAITYDGHRISTYNDQRYIEITVRNKIYDIDDIFIDLAENLLTGFSFHLKLVLKLRPNGYMQGKPRYPDLRRDCDDYGLNDWLSILCDPALYIKEKE